MRNNLTILLLLFSLNVGLSQQLSEFSGLKSQGQIPTDFLKTSTQKYKDDYANNENESLDKNFFLSTRFVIDQLLQSGKILFNEPLSIYLNEVAEYALASQPDLLKQLKFYVLKSTDVNAFSTDQGIIFFTTGLIAQLENEAQLAYILLHEVSHFTEKHVQDSYVERKEMVRGKNKYSQLGYDDRLNEMSVYKKSNELDADSKGIDMYLETEYAVDEVVSSFGVLLYSYFDTLFFDTEYLKIPSHYFPDSINPITKEEDYDDTRSTHPNIKTRIDNSFDIIDDRISKGALRFKISEKDFYEVRNLARFESIRLKLAEREYIEALYDVFLLKKDFPNNQFLEASQMKALYGLSVYKTAGRFSEVRPKLSKIEGESYVLHAMIQKLTSAQLNVIAYRHAYDLSIKYPENKLYKRYENQLKKALATNRNIDIKKFSTVTYATFSDSVEVIVEDFDIEDSIKKIEAIDLSKYQKIKIKKELTALSNSTGGSENSTSDFHYYALGDIILNTNLISDLKRIKKEQEDASSGSNLVSLDKNESIQIGLDSIIIVDPYFSTYNSSGKENLEKSEKLQEQFTNLYMDDYPTLNLHRDMVSTKSMSPTEVEKYNQLGDMYLYLSEMLEHGDELTFITSCHEEVQTMSNMYGANSVLFSKIDVSKVRKDFNIWHLYGIIFVAPIPLVLFDLRAKSYIDYRVILLDTESDELIYGDNISVKMGGNKRNIDFMVFHVLNNINSKQK